jgi:23S rRNA pseudouridine1911/1915/1917 synthase
MNTKKPTDYGAPVAADEDNVKPLLDWLLRKHPDTPRSRAKEWILAGRVAVNGIVVRRPHQVIADPGNALELRARHAMALDCGSGWQIHPRVSLLYLDSGIAIVNKGAGLLSVPAPNSRLSALSILADFLAGKLVPRNRDIAGRSLPPAYRRLHPLPVHRLDQYTSGVFCMAMNPVARQHLIGQVRAHTMIREYVAFVAGRPSAPKSTWRHWLQLSPDETRQLVLSERPAKASGSEAQEAITHFEVIAEYPLAGGRGFITKLRLRLETGLKHQIRAQAAHVGLPLLGDRTYHARHSSHERAPAPIDFPRQALHSEFLSLEHPDQPGTRISWTAELPVDIRQLERNLRAAH